jgi:hypothetical protein
MISVIGSESVSARLKSLSRLALRAFPADAFYRRFRRVHAVLGEVVVAGDGERDQGGAAVLGELALIALGERGLDLGDVLGVLEALGRVLDREREVGVGRLPVALGLDEHLLVGLLREVGGGDLAIGGARLPVTGVLVLDRLRADRAAEHECDHDEREPSEDGGLAVAGAPVAGARRECLLGQRWEPSS